jgi:hypothetical protein
MQRGFLNDRWPDFRVLKVSQSQLTSEPEIKSIHYQFFT